MHGPFGFAAVGSPEQIGQAEVAPLHTSFVVKRRFIRGHQATAPLDELAQLLALHIRQRRDVRQDQRRKLAGVLFVQQSVVDHLERDARLDERVIHALGVVLDLVVGARAAIVVPRLL